MGRLMPRICVVGAGLAGTELSWQLFKAGFEVSLYEPRFSNVFVDKVHSTNKCAELVCSNSLRSKQLHNAAGLLKQELRLCDSLLIRLADKNSLPAGSSLAVSREDFSRDATEAILSTKIKIIKEELKDIKSVLDDYDLIVIASGPNTSKSLSDSIKKIIGEEDLYFYDAIAPIIRADSIDMDICFRASRYSNSQQAGSEGDYINSPLSKKEYYDFVELLKSGDKIPLNEGDKGIFFNACMPVEVMAEQGSDSLRHGPMRGDGLIDERTMKVPFAAVQFRQDSFFGDLYNMVGFQTRLTYPEQKRIFRTLPGLKNVEFERLGSMHRNTYINAPRVLNNDMSLKKNNRVFMAGQISGVEGYIESIAQSILVAGFIIERFLDKKNPLLNSFAGKTAITALSNYIVNADPSNFQPMKINFGIFTPLSEEEKRKFCSSKKKFDRRLAMSKRSIDLMSKYFHKNN
jgi:methylenetetrahydrofolate--tRNA-(uracil-5-)-methyltransferase